MTIKEILLNGRESPNSVWSRNLREITLNREVTTVAAERNPSVHFVIVWSGENEYIGRGKI